MFYDIFALFGNVVPFLRETEASPATYNTLLQLLSDRSKSEFLPLELAVVIDAGLEILRIEYFKTVFLNTCTCANNAHFRKSGHTIC